MWPLIFGLRTYSFVYVLSMLALPAAALLSCRRLNVPRRVASALCFLYVLGMVPGAKLLYDLQHGLPSASSYLSLAYYMKGGLWGGPLAYLALALPLVAFARRDWRARLDLIAESLPWAMIVAKLACLANGCCYGTPCDLAWAVSYPPGAEAPAGIPRHPTPVYEILVLVLILLVFAALRRQRGNGMRLAWFTLIYGLGRPLTEHFRGDGPRVPDIAGFTASQFVCLVAAVLAALVILLQQRRAPRRALGRAAAYAALALVAVAFLIPLLWMVCVSLKAPAEVFAPTFLPRAFLPAAEPGAAGFPASLTRPETYAPYREIIRSPQFDFLLYTRNTLIIMVLSLAGVMLSCSIAAYGFARIPFRGRNLMFAACLATMMIPFPVIMVPTYMIFKNLGWIGSFKPLWVPAWFGGAFNIFLLRQFFMGIPKELEEAAMIDGCSRWGCFWRIIIPLSTPALAVVALFHCLAVWNDLVGPLIYLSHQEQFTLALGLQFLQSRSGDTPWNQLMAASTLIVLPVLALFLLAQRTFIRGVATTGLKG
ncbi:MAG: Prolipoprotein diacylglyceryl transferase [Phycisphaerae bacterium]|nr:Prolipoprotein diacylglyceryl transferase [Phycisphaerae bacterium]